MASVDTQLQPNTDRKVPMLDISELHRPEPVHQQEKAKEEFRHYAETDEDSIQARVRRTYAAMHANQSVEFVRQRRAHWMKFDKLRAGILEALQLLNSLVDESDPDSDLPNIVHAFQTAERIREAHPSPDMDWFALTGLIHDLGKVMALVEDEPQWAVVGDTWPVGCAPTAGVALRDHPDGFPLNPDHQNPEYNTPNGMYEPGCGFDNLLMSWGHDEYLYQVLKNHPGMKLPPQALYCIRFHSFYPWHSSGDYAHLASDKDRDMLKWLHEFNKFDLYSKSDSVPDIVALKDYYQGLVDKYIPGQVAF